MSESILTAAPITPSQAGDQSVINPANSADQRREIAVDARTRIPMSVPRAKLSSPDLPGFHTHWMNDYPGRLEQAIQAGYEFVSRDEAVLISPDLAGDPVGSGTDLGSRVSLVVGEDKAGNPLRAYLMKIRLEWFQQDQADSQARVNEIDRTIRQGRQKVDGENNPEDIAARYVKTHERKFSSTSPRRA